MANERPRLGTRVGLVLAGVLLASIALGGAWWVRETRRAIHEEIQTASHVAQQWLGVLVAETLRDPADGPARLMAHLRAVGRVRATQLEVIDVDGKPLYVSPESTYKAGRHAPAWFADRIAPSLPVRRFDAGDRQIVLRPDASRAVLDAWDDLGAGLGSATALLLLALGARFALNRALAPLAEIDRALARGADGRFDTRLPAYRVAELDRLASSYNRLADALDRSLAQTHRLEEDQAFARAVQARLEDERRLIARELHDELGQCITAVRAISGAIMQRSGEQPQIHGSAQAILAMTGQMQDGVRAILQRLRPHHGPAGGQLDHAVAEYCRLWSAHHPEIALDCETTPPRVPTGEIVGVAVLRLLQESLTNVARHACATRVSVRLELGTDCVRLEVADNGRGLAANPGPQRFGLLGMRERVAELHGTLELQSPPGGGVRISARLPLIPTSEDFPHGLHA